MSLKRTVNMGLVGLGPRTLFAIAAVFIVLFLILMQIMPESQPTQDMLTKIYDCNSDLKSLRSQIKKLSQEKQAVDSLYEAARSRVDTLSQQLDDTNNNLEKLQRALKQNNSDSPRSTEKSGISGPDEKSSTSRTDRDDDDDDDTQNTDSHDTDSERIIHSASSPVELSLVLCALNHFAE